MWVTASQGFRPEDEVSRRRPSNSRVFKRNYLQLIKYAVSIPENISITARWAEATFSQRNEVRSSTFRTPAHNAKM